MLDLGVNREFQFSGMLLTQFHGRKNIYILSNNNFPKLLESSLPFLFKQVLQSRYLFSMWKDQLSKWRHLHYYFKIFIDFLLFIIKNKHENLHTLDTVRGRKMCLPGNRGCESCACKWAPRLRALQTSQKPVEDIKSLRLQVTEGDMTT